MSLKRRVYEALIKKGATSSDKISALKGVKVAFHAAHFYSSIALNPKCFLLSDNQWFKSQARIRIQKLISLGIKPLFVFDGIEPPCLVEYMKKYDSVDFSYYIRLPFKSPENDLDVPQFYEAFHSEFHHDFMEICMAESKKDHLEFVVAPYLAATQMIYLYNEGAVQALFGPLEMLFFPNIPIIFTYNDTAIEWTTQETVLEKTKFDKEKLEDMIILWAYPQMLKEFKDPIGLIEKMREDIKASPAQYELFIKLKSLYKYPVILDADCTCRTIEKSQKMPKETQDIMGIKLPTKCYLYMFLGLINPRLLQVITSGKIVEYSFLVNSKKLAAYYTLNKTSMYLTLVRYLRLFPLMKPYLESTTSIKFLYKGEAKDFPISTDSISFWSIPGVKISEEMDCQGVKENKITPLFCMNWIVKEQASEAKNILKKSERPKDTRKMRELSKQLRDSFGYRGKQQQQRY